MIRSLSSSYFLTLLKGILAVQMYLTFLNQKIERDLLTNWVSWINNDLFSSSFLLSWRISSSAAAAVAESEINFIFSSSSLDCSWLQNWPEKKNQFRDSILERCISDTNQISIWADSARLEAYELPSAAVAQLKLHLELKIEAWSIL